MPRCTRRLVRFPEYRTFQCKRELANTEYIGELVKTEWFWSQLQDATRGVGARRERTRRTYPELLVLSALLEETGQARKALAGYRRAVKERPRNTDPQPAVIRILQRVGTGADVEAEYARLAKAHPDDPSYHYFSHTQRDITDPFDQ